MDDRPFYLVVAWVPRGTITYRCPTAEWALKKARDFAKADYAGIGITAPDGRTLTEAELALLTGEKPEVAIHSAMTVQPV